MAFATDAFHGDTVVSNINYCADLNLYKNEKPFYCNIPAPDGRQSNQETECYEKIIFHDIRRVLNDYHLDTHGFEVVSTGKESSHEDFNSDQWIGLEYYPVVETLLNNHLQCSETVIFDHTVRKRQTPETIAGDPRRMTRQPSLSAHVDQTVLSGANRVFLHMGHQAPALLKGRCQVVNVWRPLFGPLQDFPLTFCDARTVNAERDFIAADLVFPHYIGEQYLVKYHPDHKWYFLSNQRTNEFTIFKCYDSRPHGVSRFTPHTSFFNPQAPANARLRESVEFRCLVFYQTP